MNLLSIFVRPRATVRYVAATRQESAEAVAKRLALHSAMKARCASLSPADRRAAVARAARAEQGRA